MLSNSQFAAFTGCPEIIESPEVAEFAMFSIELGDVIDPATGEPYTPDNKGTAYTVSPWTEKGIASQRNAQRKEEENQRREDKQERQARVDEWAKRGYALDPRALTNPHDGAQSDAAQVVEDKDEWHDFWGGASPSEMIADD